MQMMAVMTVMITLIIHNDDDGSVKVPELVKADLVCWAGQATPENISLIFHFLFQLHNLLICLTGQAPQ